MTKRQLIAALQACKEASHAEKVFFSIPDREETKETSCLTAYLVQVEYAHDEDCTPFIRVYLEAI